ncbi:hypothetical protein GS676_02745 [Rhodococcus hoagii]|nr:hypothetical protein [Prescottella equi]
MSTRDELANLIDDAAEWATSQGRICSPHEVADAILAAGYSRPRVVETVEELDTLSRGARILTPKTGNVWWPSRHGRGWDGSNGGYTFTRDLLEQEGPATVLYLPEEKP